MSRKKKTVRSMATLAHEHATDFDEELAWAMIAANEEGAIRELMEAIVALDATEEEGTCRYNNGTKLHAYATLITNILVNAPGTLESRRLMATGFGKVMARMVEQMDMTLQQESGDLAPTDLEFVLGSARDGEYTCGVCDAHRPMPMKSFTLEHILENLIMRGMNSGRVAVICPTCMRDRREDVDRMISDLPMDRVEMLIPVAPGEKLVRETVGLTRREVN